MRRSDRELKDMADIVAIAKRETVCTVAFHDESCPYLIPLNYGAEVEEGKLVLYFHGAKEGTKIDKIKMCIRDRCWRRHGRAGGCQIYMGV